MSEHPVKGDEVRLLDQYFSHMEKRSVFTRGKNYKVLDPILGNGSVALEDDSGVMRHISPLYVGVVRGYKIEPLEEDVFVDDFHKIGKK